MNKKKKLPENSDAVEAQDENLLDFIANRSTLQMHYDELQ